MSNEVAVRQTDAIARPESFEGLMQMADALVKSGFLPSAIKTAPQAAAIMVAGREIGLSGMQSFRELYVVNGQVGMSTRLIVAFFKQFGGRYLFLERTPQTCTVRLIGPDGDEHDHTMTRDDADKMGITKEKNKETNQLQEKFNWRANPTGMLSNNAIKGAIRLWYPECLLAAMGETTIPKAEQVEVVVDGEVIEQEAHGYDPDEFDPNDPDHQAAVAASDKSGNGNGGDRADNAWTKTPGIMDAIADKYSLTYESIYEALGVKSIDQFAGTKDDAKAKIATWIEAAQAKAKATLL